MAVASCEEWEETMRRVTFAAGTVAAAAAAEGRLAAFTGMRKTIAKRMLQSKVEAAQAYMGNTVDATRIQALFPELSIQECLNLLELRTPNPTAPGTPAFTSVDYIPHHAWFQYYASTSNPTHARPSSVAAIGHSTTVSAPTDLRPYLYSSVIKEIDVTATSVLEGMGEMAGLGKWLAVMRDSR